MYAIWAAAMRMLWYIFAEIFRPLFQDNAWRSCRDTGWDTRPRISSPDVSDINWELWKVSKTCGQEEMCFITTVASEGIWNVVQSMGTGCNIVPNWSESLSSETTSASLYIETKLQTFKACIWFKGGAGLAVNWYRDAICWYWRPSKFCISADCVDNPPFRRKCFS